MVTTAHGEFTPDLADLYASVAEQVAVVAISHHQAGTAPNVPIRAVIHHGIDLDRYPCGSGGGDDDGAYVVFLGRMHPDKGVDRAIRVARAAGKRLLIAAKMWEPVEHRYFTEVVEPLLGPDAVYLGQVGAQEKAELLGAAEALVNPIRWPEPFGLVMIEALATGTPVLTFAEGAAPELVDDCVTGYVCRDETDMATQLARVGDLDRRRCRQAVQDRFSNQRMVRDHVALYEQLLGRDGEIDLRTPLVTS